MNNKVNSLPKNLGRGRGWIPIIIGRAFITALIALPNGIFHGPER